MTPLTVVLEGGTPSMVLQDGFFMDLYGGIPRTGTQPIQSVVFNALAPNLTFTLVDGQSYTIVHRRDISYQMFVAPAVFGPPVASIALTPVSITLFAGATQATSITLFDSLGNALVGRTISYDTADHSVATVNSAGVVTGVAVGVTLLTAQSGTITASIPLIVASTRTFAAAFAPAFT